jgi:hypothetical protein
MQICASIRDLPVRVPRPAFEACCSSNKNKPKKLSTRQQGLLNCGMTLRRVIGRELVSAFMALTGAILADDFLPLGNKNST